MYIKPTNSQVYLDYRSNHPEHCKNGIIYSQALRIIERCSTEEDQTVHLQNLNEKLSMRNYPEEAIQKQVNRAKNKNRSDLIFQSRRKTTQRDQK